MPVDTRIDIAIDDLAQIVTSVFQTMMGLDVSYCGLPTDQLRPVPSRLTAVVHLKGNWDGILAIECTVRQAVRMADRYLCMGNANCTSRVLLLQKNATAVDRIGESGETNEVVRDVLGEIANMIGGNVKSVLDLGLTMSMPLVVDEDYASRAPDYAVHHTLGFDSSDGVFVVTVLRSLR